MKNKLAKLISIITLTPLVAAIILTSIYFSHKSYFNNKSSWYILSIFFLTLMPLSAYALEHIIPSIKELGRKGERKLAFIMSLLGYVLGTITCLLFNSPKRILLIFLIYFCSGLILSFVNKVIKVKASGHACGVSGPLTLIIYIFGKYACTAILIIPAVFWARITMKRHTYKELILGTLVGIFATGFVLMMYDFQLI